VSAVDVLDREAPPVGAGIRQLVFIKREVVAVTGGERPGGVVAR
jgi:hypothetical protein